MQAAGPLKTVVWALAGTALLGGGLFLGILSALLGRRAARLEEEPSPLLPPGWPDQGRRVEELAKAVADLQSRLGPDLPPAVEERLETVKVRVDQLEGRLEQVVREGAVLPPMEQVLAAVERMVAVRIGGLDERLTDQVNAIELLRKASAQTDALLQKLIQAVESLAEQSAESEPVARGEARNDEGGRPDYPIA